jgi:hypothetical protein
MGSTRSHPLPPGIFVQMPSPPPVEIPATSSEFDGWTEKDFDEEIDRLNKRLKELDEIKKEEYDPDVRKMVENGEHICHMFDGECHACEMDEEEVRVLTEEEVENDPEMTAQI